MKIGSWAISEKISISFLKYQLRRCSKKTEVEYNITCLTNEEIDKMLEKKQSYLGFYTYEAHITIYNGEQDKLNNKT